MGWPPLAPVGSQFCRQIAGTEWPEPFSSKSLQMPGYSIEPLRMGHIGIHLHHAREVIHVVEVNVAQRLDLWLDVTGHR